MAIGYLAVRAVAVPIVGAEERGQLEMILAIPFCRSALIVGLFAVAA